jgi:putative hemolysin
MSDALLPFPWLDLLLILALVALNGLLSMSELAIVRLGRRQMRA